MKRYVAGIVLAVSSVFGGAAQAQTCAVPPGAVRVNDNYQPSATGNWYLIRNWIDDNPADGKINTHHSPPYHGNDTFNFVDAGTGHPVPIELPDPTIMSITSEHGTWWYITGSGAPFRIYRTQDFTTFELHMTAFDSTNKGMSNQWVDGNRLYINGIWFNHLWAPHLYQDPTYTGTIFLSFSGSQQSDSIDDISVRLARIPRAEFLAWHQKDPLLDDGTRFADHRVGLGFQQWYYYNSNNYQSGGPYIYDGGYALGNLIPASGRPAALAGIHCGYTEARTAGYAHRSYQGFYPFGYACRPGGGGYVYQGAATWMFHDPFVFIDPNRTAGDPLKRIMLYVWNDASSSLLFNHWGNHIAGHPLLHNNIQFDKNFETQPYAHARNSNNQVGGKYNGTVDGTQQQWAGGGVAEAPCAFYLPETQRYYLVYSRNTWGSAAYQLVYRMSAPGAPFSSIALSSFENQTVQEHVLLRANDYTSGSDANFGHCDFFTLNGKPYLAFHNKPDYQRWIGAGGQWQTGFAGARTVFFKELTVENYSTGKLKQLFETHTDPARDVRLFRIPVCRQ